MIFSSATTDKWNRLLFLIVCVPSKAQFSINGSLPEIQSRARLSVAGLEVLTSGLNVSRTEGYLTALLSYSPSAFNATKTRRKVGAVFTAKFEGKVHLESVG